MAEHYRTFISLPVPEPVKENIRQFQRELGASLRPDAVRWTKPEQIHLTLKFLGNVPIEKVANLIENLRQACEPFASFAMSAQGLEFFPPQRHPRVLWIGAQDEHNQLLRLQQSIEQATRHVIPSEERFTGHLTIGRAGNMRTHDARRLAEFAERFKTKSFGAWQVDAVELMRSELGSDGSHHTRMAEISLQGPVR